MTTVLIKVELPEYLNQLATARSGSLRVRQNCVPAAVLSTKIANRFWSQHRPRQGMDHDAAWLAFVERTCHIYLAKDGNEVKGGFVILEGELMGLWGPGQGEWLLREAIRLGANRLDCFDGWLTAWYAKWGFREILREPNHFKGQPDVVWMRIP